MSQGLEALDQVSELIATIRGRMVALRSMQEGFTHREVQAVMDDMNQHTLHAVQILVRPLAVQALMKGDANFALMWGLVGEAIRRDAAKIIKDMNEAEAAEEKRGAVQQ